MFHNRVGASRWLARQRWRPRPVQRDRPNTAQRVEGGAPCSARHSLQTQRSEAMSSTTTVALITGASRGLGREISREYARRGVRLILTARGPEALQATIDEL